MEAKPYYEDYEPENYDLAIKRYFDLIRNLKRKDPKTLKISGETGSVYTTNIGGKGYKVYHSKGKDEEAYVVCEDGFGLILSSDKEKNTKAEIMEMSEKKSVTLQDVLNGGTDKESHDFTVELLRRLEKQLKDKSEKIEGREEER